jgi:hypothetical protein
MTPRESRLGEGSRWRFVCLLELRGERISMLCSTISGIGTGRDDFERGPRQNMAERSSGHEFRLSKSMKKPSDCIKSWLLPVLKKGLVSCHSPSKISWINLYMIPLIFLEQSQIVT